MMKKGFTYLELVIVIVLIGILALLSIDRIQRDNLYEAADQLLSHIQYTQHLAMIDDRFDPDDANWRSKQYRIQFHNTDNNNGYSIFRDLNEDNELSSGDFIVNDPLSGKPICGKSSVCSDRLEDVDLLSKYNVSVSVSGATGARQLMFDHIGRPHDLHGDLLTNPVTITLERGSESVEIVVEQETGYSYLNI